MNSGWLIISLLIIASIFATYRGFFKSGGGYKNDRTKNDQRTL